MNIVLIGANGMLGKDMAAAGEDRRHTLTLLDLPEIDITDPASIAQAVPPADWIVNCAAYTRVDDAEEAVRDAYLVNALGPALLARHCVRHHTRMLQVSTDYVFDGRSSVPYRETDLPMPLNQYGASKLAGEYSVQAFGDFLIVRTQSLFGVHGPNFVQAIANKLPQSQAPLPVVDDQFSAPTYTGHLADALWRLIEADARGVVHCTAGAVCSWFTFAEHIAEHLGFSQRITHLSADQLNRPARRPPHAALDNARYREWTGHTLPDWRAGLQAYWAAAHAKGMS